jgi:hypothetical protein
MSRCQCSSCNSRNSRIHRLATLTILSLRSSLIFLAILSLSYSSCDPPVVLIYIGLRSLRFLHIVACDPRDPHFHWPVILAILNSAILTSSVYNSTILTRHTPLILLRSSQSLDVYLRSSCDPPVYTFVGLRSSNLRFSLSLACDPRDPRISHIYKSAILASLALITFLTS